MPWRVSRFQRDSNRCSPAVALALFPPLVLRVLEEEELIDCSRTTLGAKHDVAAKDFINFLMEPVRQQLNAQLATGQIKCDTHELRRSLCGCQMLDEPWVPTLLPDILNMLGDLNLSPDQTQALVEFVCQQSDTTRTSKPRAEQPLAV